MFTDKLSWRWWCWINLPIGAVSTAGVLRFAHIPPLPEWEKPLRERLRELDFIGPIFYMPALVALLLAMEWAGVKFPWDSPQVIGLLAAFGALTPLWIYSQHRLGERAMIPLRLVKMRTVWCSTVFAFVTGAVFSFVCLYLP